MVSSKYRIFLAGTSVYWNWAIAFFVDLPAPFITYESHERKQVVIQFLSALNHV